MEEERKYGISCQLLMMVVSSIYCIYLYNICVIISSHTLSTQGSTAEIVRILGGPAVGDIRSRLLRLAPGATREARAVQRLLGHRLISSVENDANVDDATISRMAREEWLDILDGGQESSYQSANRGNDNDDEQQSYEHPLWKDVSAPYRSVSY